MAAAGREIVGDLDASSVSPVLRVHVGVHGLVDGLPAPALLRRGERVDPPLGVWSFALELLPAVEPGRVERRRPRWPRARRSRARRRGRSRRSDRSRRGRRCRRTRSRCPRRLPATSSSRMPGVSRTSPPPGSWRSWRRVVVWRPRASSSRISRRLALLAGERVDERRLADARRPDEGGGRAGPRGAIGARRCRRPSGAESTTIGTPGRDASTATRRLSRSSARSAFERTTTG